MQEHEAATIFPEMTGEEFDELVQNIRENGLLDDIITHEEKVLDGRHRDRACAATGKPPRYKKWNGECGSPTMFVLSKNLPRRHLNLNQRAMLGAKIKESLRKEAQARMAKTQFSGTPPASENSCYPPSTPAGKSSEIAAAAVKVSAFPVEKASFVLAHGSPELVAAVQADQVAVHNAADLAKLPYDEQAAIVAKGSDVMLEKAKEIRQQRKVPEDPKPGRLSEDKPVAARGVSAVGKYLDRRIDHWSKSKEPHAEAVFAELQAVRKELVGR